MIGIPSAVLALSKIHDAREDPAGTLTLTGFNFAAALIHVCMI